MAEVAKHNHYCCPIVDESNSFHIEEGRHPVIEQVCKKEKFVPNDTYLNDQEQRLLLITGPNMAGKSTYLRQVALIVIMAQIGSFVPAKRAHWDCRQSFHPHWSQRRSFQRTIDLHGRNDRNRQYFE